jgi:hypothetical protein
VLKRDCCQVQGKEHVSAVQHVSLRDVFSLESADLKKKLKEIQFFVSFGIRDQSAARGRTSARNGRS